PKNRAKIWDAANSMSYNSGRMKVPSQIAITLTVLLAALGCGHRSKIDQLQEGVKYAQNQTNAVQKAVRETANTLPEGPGNAGSTRESSNAFSPAEILRNMPVNSESRCVGISLVAGA